MNPQKRKSPIFDPELCDFCGSCVAVCAEDAILLLENSMDISEEKCSACGKCINVCPAGALEKINEGEL